MARPVPQRNATSEIRQLLARQRPDAHCDACLALHLGISLTEARAAALSVGCEPGYVRQRRDCYACRRGVELTALSTETPLRARLNG
jgi:hypothetical protein